MRMEVTINFDPKNRKNHEQLMKMGASGVFVKMEKQY